MGGQGWGSRPGPGPATCRKEPEAGASSAPAPHGSPAPGALRRRPRGWEGSIPPHQGGSTWLSRPPGTSVPSTPDQQASEGRAPDRAVGDSVPCASISPSGPWAEDDPAKGCCAALPVQGRAWCRLQTTLLPAEAVGPAAVVQGRAVPALPCSPGAPVGVASAHRGRHGPCRPSPAVQPGGGVAV